ncbi:MAG: hypothetical protein ACOYPS_04910 [Phycisphaerales bacterium]
MDPDTALQLLLLGVVLPFVASLATTAACWWSARGILPSNARPDARRALVAAILCPLAVLVGVQWLLFGSLSFPPRHALHLIPLLLIGAAVLGRSPIRSTADVIAVIGIVWLAAAETAQQTANAMVFVLWGGAMMMLTPCARPARAWTLFVPLGFTLAGAAVALVTTGSLKLAQLAGASAVTLLGVFLVSLARPRLTIAGPALSVFVAMLAATLAQGASFGDTPRWLAYVIGLGGPAIAAGLVKWRGR